MPLSRRGFIAGLAAVAAFPAFPAFPAQGFDTVTPWVGWTTTVTEFGVLYSRRVGDTLEIRGQFQEFKPGEARIRFSH